MDGPEEDIRELNKIFAELEAMANQNGDLTKQDVSTVLALRQEYKPSPPPNPLRSVNASDDFILNTYDGEPITAKTPGQKQIVEASASNDIVFTIGPAGTGKTYTSVALAVKALKEQNVKKNIWARPVVESGETLGLLTGDHRE